MADEYHLFFFLHLEIHLIEEHSAIVGYSFKVLHFQDLVTRFAFHLEDNTWIATGRRLNFFHIELFEHLLTRSRLLALRHVSREATNKLFQLLTFFLCFLTLVLCLAECQLRRFVPERIVTREERNFTEVNVHRVGTNLVKEVAVVAHHKDSVFHIAEVFFEPFHRLEVKVIGWLVEEQVVGLTKEGLCQHHAHFLFVRKLTHEFAMEIFLDAKTRKKRCSVILCGVSTDCGKLVFEFCHFDAIFVRKLFFGIEFIALLHHLPHHSVSLEHSVEHCLVVKFEVVL